MHFKEDVTSVQENLNGLEITYKLANFRQSAISFSNHIQVQIIARDENTNSKGLYMTFIFEENYKNGNENFVKEVVLTYDGTTTRFAIEKIEDIRKFNKHIQQMSISIA